MDASIGELIEDLQANRAMFVALCVASGTERMSMRAADDRWSVREHIAHVAAHDHLTIAYLTAALRSEGTALQPDQPVGGTDLADNDSLNETEVQKRAGRSRSALLTEMMEARMHTLALLRGVQTDDLDRQIYFSGDARRSPGLIPLRLWLQQFSKHDMLHAHAILRAIPALADHPDFRAWLADDPVLEAIVREEDPSPDASGSE